MVKKIHSRQKLIYIVLMIALIFPAVVFAGSDQADEKEAVITVVQQFFDVLESRDVTVAKKLLAEGGAAFSIRYDNGEESILLRDFAALTDHLFKGKEILKETMTNPTVLIHKGIAVLWADYKFYIDGKFQHEGVDAFTLIKTPQGWKITSIVYTVEK